MKLLLIIVVSFTALIVIIYVAGLMLPQQHTASVTESFSSSADQLWSVISNFEEAATWRDDVKEVTMTGPDTFKEISKGGDAIDYRIENSSPPVKMVTRIITPDLPFGGGWTYELAPSGTGCTLSVTENGEVFNPIFRFLSKFIFGHDTTLKNYMKNLKKKIQ